LANYCGGEKILSPLRFQHFGGERPRCPRGSDAYGLLNDVQAVLHTHIHNLYLCIGVEFAGFRLISSIQIRSSIIVYRRSPPLYSREYSDGQLTRKFQLNKILTDKFVVKLLVAN